jgi:hypothetical protein
VNAPIEAMVERYRRHARNVRFARTALGTTATAVAILTAWAVAAGPSIVTSEFVGYGVLGILVLSASVAILTTPSAMTMAHQIDRRLATQNHVAAGLHLARDGSAMSVLVVRGAVQKLSAARPADVVPWALTQPAAAVVISLTVALLATSREQPMISEAGLAGSGAGTQLRETADAAAEGSAVADTSARTSNASRTKGPEMIPASAPKSLPEGGPKALDATSSGDAGRRADNSETLAVDARAVQGQAAASPRVRSFERDGAPGVGRSDARVDSDVSRRPAEHSGVAGTGGAVAVQGGARAGGVSDGALGGRTSSLPVATRPQAASQITALARAQAAASMTNDDIPPGFRRYVRNYFLRLQSESRR